MPSPRMIITSSERRCTVNSTCMGTPLDRGRHQRTELRTSGAYARSACSAQVQRSPRNMALGVGKNRHTTRHTVSSTRSLRPRSAAPSVSRSRSTALPHACTATSSTRRSTCTRRPMIQKPTTLRSCPFSRASRLGATLCAAAAAAMPSTMSARRCTTELASKRARYARRWVQLAKRVTPRATKPSTPSSVPTLYLRKSPRRKVAATSTRSAVKRSSGSACRGVWRAPQRRSARAGM
mmetsp:Transcript_14358/g.48644  ORF Transcript_14358/g.48644 Transcript_14358/m.48644 type:complete len:237 (-) Transcript_14358:133-843(-)